MKATMIKAVILGMLAGLAWPHLVEGKDIYVAQSAAGNASGSDAGDAYPSSWFNTAGNWGSDSNQINPGDVVHLVGTFTNSIAAQGSGSPGNYITILFEPNANFTMAAGSAIALGNNNYITVDGGQNGLIQNTANGTSLSQHVPVNGIYSAPSIGNIIVKNLTLTNLYVHVPGVSDSAEVGSGIYFTGVMTNIDVHGCHISQIQHGVLVNYQPGGVSANINIYSNTILNCSWGIGFGSGNNNAVLNGVTIANNTITGQSTWNTANNYFHENGVYIYAESPGAMVTNITVAGNTFGPDNGGNSTAALFLSASAAGPTGGLFNLQAYNNIFYAHTVYVNMGFICLGEVNGAKILNNTLDAGISGSPGLVVATCTNVVFCNNIYSDGQQAVTLKNGAYNWWTTQCATMINSIDYNDYYNLTGGSAGFGGNGGGSFKDWQASGYDPHSVMQNPNFVDQMGANFHLKGANGAGTNLTSLGISGLNVDKSGNPRPATGTNWDAGAYQFLNGTAPPPPTGLRILNNQ